MGIGFTTAQLCDVGQKLLDLSVLWFPHLQNKDKYRLHLIV